MTWLDWFVRQRAELVGAGRPPNGHPSPRKVDGAADALAAVAEQIQSEARAGASQSKHAVALFCQCMEPFTRGFLPPERRGGDPGPALGLVLKRETADLLADADPPSDDAWRRRVFGARPDGDGLGAVYVDVPHGALRLGTGLQIRALIAAPWTPYPAAGDVETPRDGMVLVAIVVTEQGSERLRGVLFAAADAEGVLGVGLPDNTLVGFLHANFAAPGGGGDTQAKTFRLVMERAVGFLRLVLAFHRYGPSEARRAIGVTSTDAFAKNRNRPKKGESIFAMVKLSAPVGHLGRPPRAASAGWSLNSRQEVSGHFRLQPYGAGGSLRRLIWVSPYERGPDAAAVRPRAVKL